MTAELDLARQWVLKANNDLLNADNNLRAETIPFDTVCFHCQQAAEKLFAVFEKILILDCHSGIPRRGISGIHIFLDSR